MKMTTRKTAIALTTLTCSLVLAGCGSGLTTSQGFAPVTQGNVLRGHSFGGQQPLSSSTVQLYMAGTTGYGSAATSLNALNGSNPVLTDSNGNFSITSYNASGCTPSSNEVYILSSGGNAGAGANSAALLMGALGTCAQVASWSSFINLNELTTVSAAWALSPFMTDITHVGTSSTNTTGLSNAFKTAAQLVNISSGYPDGTGAPSGTTLPVDRITAMGDILGACINSAGPGSSACSTVLGNAGGGTATDVGTAAALIAQNPWKNVSTLYGVITGNPAYATTLSSAPTDWTLAVNYTGGGGLNTPKGVTVGAAGDLWVPNSGNNTVTELSSTGAVLSTTTGLNAPYAVAIDASGNAWVANYGNSTLAEISSGGSLLNTYSTGGLDQPTSITIDSTGNLWLSNGGNNTVTAIASNGTALSGSPFSGGGVSTPVGIAVTPH